jgi:DNA-binding Xre family transcriptional regulator
MPRRKPRATRNRAAEQLEFYPQRLIAARNIAHPVAWLQKLGFHAPTAVAIANGSCASLKWHQIEILCTALNCTPNDLLKFDHKHKNLPANHELLKLQRTDSLPELQVQLQQLSPEKLEALQVYLKGE